MNMRKSHSRMKRRRPVHQPKASMNGSVLSFLKISVS